MYCIKHMEQDHLKRVPFKSRFWYNRVQCLGVQQQQQQQVKEEEEEVNTTLCAYMWDIQSDDTWVWSHSRCVWLYCNFSCVPLLLINSHRSQFSHCAAVFYFNSGSFLPSFEKSRSYTHSQYTYSCVCARVLTRLCT